MVAGLANVEDGVEVGSLSAGRKHASHASFQCCYLGSHGIVGRILQACIEVTLFLQVEKLGHLVGIVVFEGCALYDGQLDRLTVFGLIACMHAERSHS